MKNKTDIFFECTRKGYSFDHAIQETKEICGDISNKEKKGLERLYDLSCKASEAYEKFKEYEKQVIELRSYLKQK